MTAKHLVSSRFRMFAMSKKMLSAAILTAAALLSAAFIFTLFPGTAGMPSFEAVRSAHSRTESILLDRHGQILHEQRTNDRARRLDWIPVTEVSPAFTAALLHAEDRHFYDHHGVDWVSLGSATAGLFRSGLRGASTISMQVAGQLDEDLRPSRQRRNVWQKWLQIRGARALERRWSKDQMLEAYLNLVSFRGELQGIAAAAGGLFDKRAHGLTDAESVILAALVRAPNADGNQVGRRASVLAAAMKLDAAPAEIAARAAEVLSRPYFIRPQAALAPQVAQRLFREARSRQKETPDRLSCTLDLDLQQTAAEILLRHLATVRAQNVHDGAVLALDNRTGEVLAYVGNSGEQASARYVDGVQALRQAGSTLKPFIYGAAFDRRLLTAASLLDDSPLDVATPGGIYRPANYDKMFHGLVTARVALASSLNVPAVKTLNLISVEAGLNMLRAAGFASLQADDFYGSSLALGAADVSLWELANAYRALANRGTWSPLRLTGDAVPGGTRQILSPAAAFLVADILSDRESRSRTFNLESPLSTRFWTAVKTGTSKDMRDNWCVGFSDQYTVGVWVGNFSGAPMWNVSGITGAAPVWVEIMNWLHRRSTSVAPKAPAGIRAQAVPGDESRRELFIQGTEQALMPGEAHPDSRIVYPAAGTVIALDPDIPLEEQRLFLEAQPRDGRLRWVLDGQGVGNAGTLHLWAPVRGKHVLALVNAAERILDSVTFEVRGSVR
jgi:penicillin-binding protein 1C